MSVLGATKWYVDADPNQREEQLVLGKYPLQFGREIQALIPGELFGSYIKEGIVEYDNEGEKVYSDSDDESVEDDMGIPGDFLPNHRLGLLLPCSRKGKMYFDGRFFGMRDFLSHETLRDWVIDTQGSVDVKRVCALASSSLYGSRKINKVLRCSFLGFNSHNPPNVSENDEYAKTRKRFQESGFDIDLHAWVQTRSYVVHAVVSMHRAYLYYEVPKHLVGGTTAEDVSTIQIYGIILQEKGPGTLVKLGNFYISDLEGKTVLPESSEVHWVIL